MLYMDFEEAKAEFVNDLDGVIMEADPEFEDELDDDDLAVIEFMLDHHQKYGNVNERANSEYLEYLKG